MRLLILTLILTTLFSCKKENKSNNHNLSKPTLQSEKELIKNVEIEINAPIKLGENINGKKAYAKSIYKKNGLVYIDIDIIIVEYHLDGMEITNNNPKIRTYIIDENSSVTTKDCNDLNLTELIAQKNMFLNDESVILIVEAENGKIVYINCCYG